MPTTRPVASETTGTFRAMSGVTVPVTTNSDNAGRSVAIARGNCSGCSTPNKPGSAANTTFGDGGASAVGSLCFVHPAITASPAKVETRRIDLRFRSPLIVVPICGCSPILLSSTALELDHDRVSHTRFVFAQIGAPTAASCHTSETRGGRQEGARRKGRASHHRTSCGVGNCAGSRIDAWSYSTSTRPVPYICVAIPILCSESDVLFRHIVKGERGIPSSERIAGVLREIRRTGDRIRSVDRRK